MEAAELAVMRKQTKQFIEENPTQVDLTRTTRVADGSGGFKTTTAPRQTQTFRKIIQGGNVASRNIDGESTSPSYVFLGLFDADIAKGDVFTIDGRDYSVDFVRDRNENSYETWAEVTFRG